MFLSLSFSSWLSQAVGGASPRSLTEHFSEVLLSLNRHCPALLSQWLKETLQAPGFPSAQVSSEQKLAFTQQLLRWGQPPIVVDAWGTKSLLLERVAQILRLILFVFLQGANQQAAYEGDREGVCSALPGPAGRWILSLQTELVTHKLFPAWVRLRQSKGKKKQTHFDITLTLAINATWCQKQDFSLADTGNKCSKTWTEEVGLYWDKWSLCFKKNKTKQKHLSLPEQLETRVSPPLPHRPGIDPLLRLTTTPINTLFFAAAWATVCECYSSSVVYCLKLIFTHYQI